MSQFDTSDVAELGGSRWRAETEGNERVYLVDDGFPAQVEVVEEGENVTISLYVYNEQRGFMDLLSAEYQEEFPHGSREKIIGCVQDYLNTIESGELDQYRSGSSV